jgi:hypothetical protein
MVALLEGLEDVRMVQRKEESRRKRDAMLVYCTKSGDVNG